MTEANREIDLKYQLREIVAGVVKAASAHELMRKTTTTSLTAEWLNVYVDNWGRVEDVKSPPEDKMTRAIVTAGPTVPGGG